MTGIVLIAEKEGAFKDLVEEIRTLIRIQEPTMIRFLKLLDNARAADRRLQR